MRIQNLVVAAIGHLFLVVRASRRNGVATARASSIVAARTWPFAAARSRSRPIISNARASITSSTDCRSYQSWSKARIGKIGSRARESEDHGPELPGLPGQLGHRETGGACKRGAADPKPGERNAAAAADRRRTSYPERRARARHARLRRGRGHRDAARRRRKPA